MTSFVFKKIVEISTTGITFSHEPNVVTVSDIITIGAEPLTETTTQTTYSWWKIEQLCTSVREQKFIQGLHDFVDDKEQHESGKDYRDGYNTLYNYKIVTSYIPKE